MPLSTALRHPARRKHPRNWNSLGEPLTVALLFLLMVFLVAA